MEGLTPIIYGISGIVLFVAGIPALVWLAVVFRNRLLARNAPSRLTYFLSAIAMAVVPLILIEGVVVLQAILAYDGSCYGFTDGSWPCSRMDFVLADASYGIFILIPFTGLYVPAALIVFFLGWRRRFSPRSV